MAAGAGVTIYSHTVTLIGSVWPALIGAVIFHFRNGVKVLLSRLEKVGREGAQFTPSSHQKNVDVSRTIEDAGSAMKFIAPAYQPVMEELAPQVRQVIDKELENDGPDARERLSVYTADLLVALLLERVYASIFGSQLAAIEHVVNLGGRVPVSDINVFYDRAARDYGELYSNYSFEQWLGFMRDSGLIEKVGETVVIKPLGRALLPYIFGRGYGKMKAA